MDSFGAFFELGLRHIADLDGYDHMLFLLALVAVYQITDLKQIIILVTAFTLGHSLTLFLATTDAIRADTEVVEFLIPCTIFITAVWNIARGKRPSNMFWPYFFAAFFGLVHGLGFSTYLRNLLKGGDELFIPLLAFNLGIEVGQIIIVVTIMLLSVIAFQLFRFKHRDWILVLSGAAAGISLLLMKDNLFWM